MLSLYQISGFVYFRKPASVLATANIRHLLSVLGYRDGLIPFSDGEPSGQTEFGYVHTSDFDLMLL